MQFRRSAHLDAAPDNRQIGAEPISPHVVAEERDRLRPLAAILRRQCATNDRLHAAQAPRTRARGEAAARGGGSDQIAWWPMIVMGRDVVKCVRGRCLRIVRDW
jgi:hypothetical protein